MVLGLGSQGVVASLLQQMAGEACHAVRSLTNLCLLLANVEENVGRGDANGELVDLERAWVRVAKDALRKIKQKMK